MYLNESNFNLFYPNNLINVKLYYDLSYIQNTNQENINFQDLYHTRNFEKNKFSKIEFGYESVFNQMKIHMKSPFNVFEHPQTLHGLIISNFDNLTMFEHNPLMSDVVTA